jgi:hypothetical protein
MRASIAALALTIALAGCGGGNNGSASRAELPTSTSSSSATVTPGAELVGEWQRVTTCGERVAALKAAGLGRFAAENAAGEGWIPGVSTAEQLEDPAHPCRGAVPLKHSHFFTAEGQFGSRDAHGDQVDDGTYQVTGPGTIVITKEFGPITFHYSVSDSGEVLTLDPVLPACASDGCFAAQWAVGMSYTGLPWSRSS